MNPPELRIGEQHSSIPTYPQEDLSTTGSSHSVLAQFSKWLKSRDVTGNSDQSELSLAGVTSNCDQ